MGKNVRRAVGSNQYVDRLSNVDQVDEVEGLRRLQERVGNGAPVSSAKDFRNYQALESAHVSSLKSLMTGPFDRKKAETDAKFISETQDRILTDNPNSYGLAILKAAKLEAVSKVSGEPNPLESEVGTLYAQMQGEMVEEEDLDASLQSLTAPSGEGPKELPVFLALSSSTSGNVEEKVKLLDDLRRLMSEEMSKNILGS